MLQALNTYVSKYGVFNGVIKLNKDEGALCFAFAKQYVIAQALLLAAASLVVVINGVLKVGCHYFFLMSAHPHAADTVVRWCALAVDPDESHTLRAPRDTH